MQCAGHRDRQPLTIPSLSSTRINPAVQYTNDLGTGERHGVRLERKAGRPEPASRLFKLTGLCFSAAFTQQLRDPYAIPHVSVLSRGDGWSFLAIVMACISVD